jgi:hypothetical protein
MRALVGASIGGLGYTEWALFFFGLFFSLSLFCIAVSKDGHDMPPCSIETKK